MAMPARTPSAFRGLRDPPPHLPPSPLSPILKLKASLTRHARASFKEPLIEGAKRTHTPLSRAPVSPIKLKVRTRYSPTLAYTRRERLTVTHSQIDDLAFERCRSGVCTSCLAGRHDGVGRVGLASGPSRRVFPSLQAGIFKKRNFPRKSRCQPSPMGDLMLVGLESGLPCHKKDCGCRRVPPNHHSSWYSTPPSPIE